MAIKTANKVSTCCITVKMIARWQRPVASGEALVLLHWVMCVVSHRCTAMAIEMARDGGEFVH